MPRPKGSKNKKNETTITADQIREQIANAEAKLEELNDAVKATKAEIKSLQKQLVAAEEAEAAAKAEADKEAVLAAFLASGKSAEEAIALLEK